MRWLTDGLDQETKARAINSLRMAIDNHETDEGVRFSSAAWLIRPEALMTDDRARRDDVRHSHGVARRRRTGPD